MGLEKQFEVCFLVKKFDLEQATSKHSNLPHAMTDSDQPNSRFPCSSSPKIKDENTKDNKSEVIFSCQTYRLPSLSRNYTSRVKKIEHRDVIPQVSIQGQKYFEEVEDKMTEKLRCVSQKSSPENKCFKPCSMSCVDNVNLVNTEDDGEGSRTVHSQVFMEDIYNSKKHNIPGLEGRKVNLETKLREQRTLRRIQRLKTLQIEEKRALKEFHLPITQKVHYEKLIYKAKHSENKLSTREKHKNRIKKSDEKKLIELPKVESYDILTPRRIITSDVCHVFKESTVAKVTVSESKRGLARRTDKNRQWKKAIMNEVFGQAKVVEVRNPSPVHGLKLDPKKELETINEALKLVEESNSAEDKKIGFEEEKVEMTLPLQKFVIHLPPIC